MVQTALKDIVAIEKIGARDNPIIMNNLLQLSTGEKDSPSSTDKIKNLLLVIDLQNDFMENGSLAVPNSHHDVHNLINWSFKNIGKITDIIMSQDAHKPYQIFHPAWWSNKVGHHPDPFTVITKKDVDDGIWIPKFFPKESSEYLAGLENAGKKKLIIWPYHCLEGTFGQAIENQFTNFVYFHTVVRQSDPTFIVKGQNPLSEMYGIFKAEYDPKMQINTGFLNKLKNYNKIIIAGEAKSHCVLESITQIVEHFKDKDKVVLKKIYILEDCMSCIHGFEKDTETTFKSFKDKYSLNLVNTKNFTL